jgi:hypothetical protein
VRNILIITIMLLGAAFYNGYPLVYSDTGTYIFSAYDWKVPGDRPITYGLFILFCSLGWSLWLPVLVQCVLLAWLLQMLLKPLVQPFLQERCSVGMLSLVGVLCAISPLPWYAGQLMPDIFTAMQLLIVAIVFTHQNISRSHWFALGSLFVLCSIVHFSNLFIGFITIAVWSALHWRKTAQSALFFQKRRAAILLVWCIAAFLILPTVNWLVERQFSLGKGGFTFIMGRMVDSGLLKMYLDDHCQTATEPYRLCQYKDSLPDNSRAFHWDLKSPLNKEGGWGAPEAEYRAIVFGTLTSPKYIALHCWKSLIATPSQLMQNAIGSGLDYGWYKSPESPPAQAVKMHYPHEFNEYKASRQAENLWGQSINFDFLNSINFWVLLATAIGLLLILSGLDGGGALYPVVVLLLIGVIANAFVTANLAVICDRFSPRVTWLLTLCVGVWFLEKAVKTKAKT